MPVEPELDPINLFCFSAQNALVVFYITGSHYSGVDVKVRQAEHFSFVAHLIEFQNAPAGEHGVPRAVFCEKEDAGDVVEEPVKQ